MSTLQPHFLTLETIDIHGKHVMIREDLNVPLQNGVITNDARIRAALPTIQYALTHNAAITILSHLGRPTEGQPDQENSLAPVAKRLEILLNRPVRFEKDSYKATPAQLGEIVLWENVRFNVGEKNNDAALAETLVAHCDVFVMDAFAAAHRAHASTCAAIEYAPIACAGPLFVKEVEALTQVLENPDRPLVAIVGGAKVSTKLTVLENLLKKVDQLIVGGGIANTFLAAAGFPVGRSLYEPDLVETAKQLLKSGKIPLPTDVVVATEISENANTVIKSVHDVAENDLILDIGEKTIEQLTPILQNAKTILWNGPVGIFELAPFANGTKKIASTIANSQAFTVAGGGDTVAAIEQFGIADKISYISTAGGAFLEFVEGKKLPAIEALNNRYLNL